VSLTAAAGVDPAFTGTLLQPDSLVLIEVVLLAFSNIGDLRSDVVPAVRGFLLGEMRKHLP